MVLYDLAAAANQDWLISEAWSWQGCVDIWVNNAGVDVLTGELAGVSFEEKMERLTARLYEQFAEANQLEAKIRENLETLGYGQ